ncbi:GIY-YIG nuclease family protein [Noviherbaspirillum galbum]|uniref:GIY-YIG nuclease family protein n=1 Tax=Noviherbaspirillum galbum TaxID=2709383 RepID=A0A6B3SQX8_9BURK|nr:GIY-YIG nuclease family protein [Noviherbaspirillum galbum]NEX60069.1 GIY-YIG nuclease family protein [Noviherbaspirillum galbum]
MNYHVSARKSLESKKVMADTDPLDLIYRGIVNRKNNCKISGARPFGDAMVAAAESFLKNPSQSALDTFAQSERAWVRYACEGTTRLYSHDFEKALKKGQIKFTGNVIKNSWSRKDNPSCGWVYSFWTPERPNLVKIGSTTTHPQDRATQFAKKYGITGIKVMFFFEVEKPRLAEHELHKVFKAQRVMQDKRDSIEWFEVTPSEAWRAAGLAIKNLRIPEVGRSARHPRIDEYTQISLQSREPARKHLLTALSGEWSQGGRRVTQQDVLNMPNPKTTSSTDSMTSPRAKIGARTRIARAGAVVKARGAKKERRA